MAENEHDADRELAREHVLEAQPRPPPGHVEGRACRVQFGEGHDRIDHDRVQQAYS